MVLKMAFRNIWRNKRRTLITAASVMFAGFLTITLSSIETGMWEKMLQGVIDQTTGQVQVQSKNFMEEPTLDNSFSISKGDLKVMLNTKHVTAINPRIESFSLAAFRDKTKPVYILGVDPASENTMTGLASKIVEGDYLIPGIGKGILIGHTLANKLNIRLGDSLAFLGQGYRGAFSVGIMPVRGLVRFPLEEMNSQMVFMNHDDAWDLLQAPGLYTQIMVRTKSNQHAAIVKNDLTKKLSSLELKVYDWKDLIPELVKAKEMDESTTKITMLILYIIVGFGMFGTLLMLLNERKYELGVLIAIGMKKKQLMAMIWLEFWMMSIIGLTLAMILAICITGYLHLFPIPLTGMEDVYQQFGFDPVLTATVSPSIFIKEIIKVTIIVSMLSLYPLWKIYSLHPLQAMRS